MGWEVFTDRVISELSKQRQGIVFLLWGNYAKAKETLIDTSKHYVLKSAHPSPLSAYNGFFGCKHFSKTNDILKKQGLSPIDWGVIGKVG
jgi:uracil-DNA glycosylase